MIQNNKSVFKPSIMTKYILSFLLLGMFCTTTINAQSTSGDEEWIQLFNGKNLEGWTPKFTGSEAGVNYKNTFRVEDGVLKVSYDNWDSFDGEFGHLFYDKSFSNYRLRAEYRFVGEQVNYGPGRGNTVLESTGIVIQPREFPFGSDVQKR